MTPRTLTESQRQALVHVESGDMDGLPVFKGWQFWAHEANFTRQVLALERRDLIAVQRLRTHAVAFLTDGGRRALGAQS